MPTDHIKDIFARRIDREIREVIKVDQTDEGVIREEIAEYVATKTISGHFVDILESYAESPRKPSDRMAVWVSGFFGSGKSMFAKLLGLALANRAIGQDTAAGLLADQIGDPKVKVLLSTIVEKIPSNAVIFDVATERGVMHGNQMLTEIMYRQLLGHLGYATDLDLAELEITLEGQGQLDEFKKVYKRLYPNEEWDREKGKIAFALNKASRVLNELDNKTYPAADSWVKAAKERADISPNLLADRCKELCARRGENRSLVFVIDEVGQFVARTVNKMLDLQGIVQALGRVGLGKFWVIITSQEKLNELVGGLDGSRVELARLMDRFPIQVHLEPSDISEVTSKRVLAKTAEAEKALGELFEHYRGSLMANTTLTADIRLPELTRQTFIDLYPMLPYQVDMIIHVVSGLRTQSGASRHVGGANRTVIKIAHQLLVHPKVGLADHSLGDLVRIDHIYDLVRDNIDSTIRDKIDRIPTEVTHPLAQPVAKAICLLQFVKSIHRTTENIAAALYPSVLADSRRVEVQQALEALIAAHKIRHGDDGYRIPTPVEDDWETQRAGIKPRRADSNQILREVVEKLWEPQPQYTLMNTRVFKGGLFLDGRERVKGDIHFYVSLAEDRAEYDQVLATAKRQSQVERGKVFWVIQLDERIDREVTEMFRSKEMLTKRERGAQTQPETRLLAEEARRRDGHRDEIRRQLEQAFLAGTIFFQGGDRSPDENDRTVGKAAEAVMAQALPEVFDRFAMGAARVAKSDIIALVENADLRGLPAVFGTLHLLRTESGTQALVTDSGPLCEMLAWISNKSDYGINPQGKALEGEYGKDPYGWDFDVVKLFTLCLLRAGQIIATSQGQSIESVADLTAKEVFVNNNLFRAATFRPKKSIDFAEILKAADAYKKTFGEQIKEVEQTVVAAAIRTKVQERQKDLRSVHLLLDKHSLPGADVFAGTISQMEQLTTANEEETILGFSGCHAEIKESLARAADIHQAVTEPQLVMLGRARQALSGKWPFLDSEPDVTEDDRKAAADLDDLLRRETFYRELPRIDQAAARLEKLYGERFKQTVQGRADCYAQALEQLRATPGWEELDESQQGRIAQPLAGRADTDVPETTPIPQLRADIDACSKRLADAVAEVHRLVEGDRIVVVKAGGHFGGGIDTEEQLDAALGGLREECLHHIGKNKRVLIQ